MGATTGGSGDKGGRGGSGGKPYKLTVLLDETTLYRLAAISSGELEDPPTSYASTVRALIRQAYRRAGGQ